MLITVRCLCISVTPYTETFTFCDHKFVFSIDWSFCTYLSVSFWSSLPSCGCRDDPFSGEKKWKKKKWTSI